MKEQDPSDSNGPRRVYYPESINPSQGYSKQPAEDVFGRRDASPIEIEEALNRAFLNKPPKIKLPKGQ